MNKPLSIKIADIRTDGGTQPRAELDTAIVQEYAEAIESGVYLPPVELVYDGNDYWLWDGFHRVQSAKKANKQTIAANVQQGTRRDAVLYSVGANAAHGLRRTNEDKRRAVLVLLNDSEWQQWSDREIARRASVSNRFVSNLRSEIVTVNSSQLEAARTYTTKHGTVATMNTANIGKQVQPVIDYEVEAEELSQSETAYTWTAPQAEIPVTKAEPKKDHITLDAWNETSATDRALALATKGTHTFNTTNDNIEWASWSWNPVTGCLHGCTYCYARDIASRFYGYLGDTEERFKPVFYPERLTAPANTKQPDLNAIDDPVKRLGKQNVFVCSMADLFGKWVPNEWIEAVLQQAWDNPQWNFLFLTKFPIRMAEFEYPDNAWLGTTVDKQWAVERAEKAFDKLRVGGYRGVAWLSCEPMLEKLTFSSLNMFDWLVVGGSSGSNTDAAFKPPFDWTVHLWNQAKRYGLPVYMKTNLGIENEVRVREYPVEL